ncbi:MAG: hypothetical protein PWP27_632 [Clostridiales bacterium]|nr:hypothetical protein [Clostridiales bacterium]
MKVNILMPVYNGENLLNCTINNILNQTYKDFTFIIVNDHSDDNTLNILNSHRDRTEKIKIVNSTNKKGIVAALNEGINHLDNDCEYVARMDCGDICTLDRIEKQVKFLDSNMNYVAVGSQFEIFCEEGNLGEGILRFQDYSNCICNYEDIKENYTVMAMFAHPTLMFRKAIFNIIGVYDEKYYPAEDYEIVSRLLTRNFKVHKIPEILVKCRFTPSEGISQVKRTEQVKVSLRIKLEFIKNNFLNVQNRKNVIIWGIKEFAGYLEEELRDPKYQAIVKCFTDFDETSWGKNKNGLPIISPEEVMRNITSDDIIITMWNIERERIISFLNENGLKRNKNYFVFS